MTRAYDFESLREDLSEIKQTQALHTQELQYINRNNIELKTNIEDVGNTLNHPRDGVYVRVAVLERARAFWVKIFWLVASSGVGLIAALLFKH